MTRCGWYLVIYVVHGMWHGAATLLISSCLSLSFYPKKVFKLTHLLKLEGLVLVHFVLIVIEMWPVIKNPIRLQPGHLCTLQHFPVPGEGTLMPDI